MNWARWEGARACTTGPQPGARALLAWIAETYPGYSVGIFNCRVVAGTGTNSVHGEGRALDWGLRQPSPSRANPVGHRILQHIGAHGDRLGIQTIIWDRRIYSRSSPEGRTYTGRSPHLDHLHIEETWAAARNLTLATLRAVLGGRVEVASPASPTLLPRSCCMYMAWHKGVVWLFSHDQRGLPVRRGWGLTDVEVKGYLAMGVHLGGEVNDVVFNSCKVTWV